MEETDQFSPEVPEPWRKLIRKLAKDSGFSRVRVATPIFFREGVCVCVLSVPQVPVEYCGESGCYRSLKTPRTPTSESDWRHRLHRVHAFVGFRLSTHVCPNPTSPPSVPPEPTFNLGFTKKKGPSIETPK